MTDSVVQPEGVVIPTLIEIIERVGSALKASVDPALLVSVIDVQNGSSPEANLLGTFASEARQAYESIQSLAQMNDPQTAEGERLGVVCSITGTKRSAARKSAFTGSRRAVANLNAGKTLNAGARFSVVGHPDFLYETIETVTNAGGTAVDVPVAALATKTGKVPGNATTATVMATPESGWNSINNPTDCLLGDDIQKDPPLRVKRLNELRSGGGNVDAIRAALLRMASTDDPNVQPIIEAFVLSNDLDVSTNGIPAHGIEVVIWDNAAASDDDIAATIFSVLEPGTAMSGVSSADATDSYGRSHTMRWTRVTQRTVTNEIDFLYDPATYAGDTAAKSAIASAYQTGLDYEGDPAEGTKQRPAMGVSFSAYMAVLQSVKGVKVITDWQSKLDGGILTSWTNEPIADREMAVISTVNITLNGTAIS